MNFADLYPSRYLKASDLADGPVTVVIESLDQEEVGKEKQVKPVMRFRGVQKPLILNRTNATAIARIHGQNVTGWAGKAVLLYSTTVEVGGDSHDAIRIRAPAVTRAGMREAAARAVSPKAFSQTPSEPPPPEQGDPGPWGNEIPF